MDVENQAQSDVDAQLAQQDTYIDAIHKGVLNMKQNAMNMGRSLQGHLDLTDDMQRDADDTSGNVRRANSKLNTVREKEGGFCNCGAMAMFLVVAAIICVVLVILIVVL
jgi:hypothetical protein